MLSALRDRLKARSRPPRSLFIKDGYLPRDEPAYFEDTTADDLGVVHQPDVYPFAAHLARLYGCSHLIDVGCGRADKLAPFSEEFRLVGVDYGSNIAQARQRFPLADWIEWDLERFAPIPLPEASAGGAIVCADVIEHLRDPMPLLRNLRRLLDDSPFALLSTPERDIERGRDHRGPPDNPHHVREWNLAELEQLLEWAGFRIPFIGLTASHDDGYPKATILAVLESPTGPIPVRRPAPEAFQVVALMPVYNEADVIEESISALAADGVGVYVIDNWSTDETPSIVEALVGRGVVGIERFPGAGPAPHYQWRSILLRMEELSETLEADWFIHVDPDELRRSPWPGVGLRDAIYFVDQSGFNCIDHTVLNFHPVNPMPDEGDLEHRFRFFEFGQHPAHFLELKAWKNLGVRPARAESGGHDTVFPGRRVYPYKFLLQHYPIRSQSHGERKVFFERIARFDPEERALGWHSHYDDIDQPHRFVREPAELVEYSRERFDREYLVERLSGVGVLRTGAR
jgi:SAM-dependent methyltransferase